MNKGNNLLDGLNKAIKLVYDHMIAKLNSGNYPKGYQRDTGDATSIQDATRIDPAQITQNGGSASIIIDLKKAPYAAAIELGSGLHGPKGSTYPITPRPPKKKLVFYWEKVGRVVAFPSVNHPGFEARPYIAPTVEETKDEVKKILGEAFVAEVVVDVKKDEVIRVEL